jgi:hypothetical protein
LDSFYAATLTAEHAGFVGGGDYLTIEATGFELQWNDNTGRWPLDMGPAVVDWAVTFPAVDSDLDGKLEPVGKPIRTGAKDAGGREHLRVHGPRRQPASGRWVCSMPQ